MLVALKITMHFCKDTMATKEEVVNEATDLIAMHCADFAQYYSVANVLRKEVRNLDASADDAIHDRAASPAPFNTVKED